MCRQHQTPEVLQKLLSIASIDETCFKEQRYTGPELSRLLVENAQNSIFDHHTLSVAQKSLLRTPLSAFANSDLSTFNRVLVEYFRILDDCFFSGALHRAITLEPGYDMQEGAPFGEYFTESRVLYLNLRIQGVDVDFEVYLRRRIGTMAHEMVHAFLDVFSCACSDCQVFMGSQDGVGRGGHGVLWCDSMSFVARWIERDLGWECSAGIGESLQLDREAGFWGDWKPSEELDGGCGRLAEWGERRRRRWT